MRKQNIALLVLIIFTLIFIPACGGGGSSGGGGTGNDKTRSISPNIFYTGDLGTYDTEIFNFSIIKDTFISVETYGIRFSQGAWLINAPIVTLVDKSVTPAGINVLTHELDIGAAPTWIFGLRDTEIPLYFLDYTNSSGSQNFAIEVRRQSPAGAGGTFKIRVNEVDIATPFGTTQFENELAGGNHNNSLPDLSEDAPAPALDAADEIIREGSNTDEIVIGHHTNDEKDFYWIDISATASDPVIACFELFAHRNGILVQQITTDYPDLELELYDPLGTLVNRVDDTFYFDPQICRKVTTNSTYKLAVTESTGGGSPEADTEYILKYTEELIANTDIFTETAAGISTPDFIAAGQLIEGDLNDSGDSDWYSFNASRGDMIVIRQFDDALADDVNGKGKIKLELHAPDNNGIKVENLIPFDGPAYGRSILAALGDMTTRAILLDDSGLTDYRVKISDDSSAGDLFQKNYSFMVEVVKAATFENELLATNPLLVDAANDRATAAGQIGTNTADDPNSDQDIDLFVLDATNLGDMNITAGDTVLVHIYATDDVDIKANDTTGWGSQLEPKLSVLDDTAATLVTTSYVSDTTSTQTSEGLRSPFPTLTVAFEATGSTFYQIKVEDSGSWSNPSTRKSNAYLIEIINLGQ